MRKIYAGDSEFGICVYRALIVLMVICFNDSAKGACGLFVPCLGSVLVDQIKSTSLEAI